MLNKLVKSLLILSAVLAVTSLTVALIKPVNAESEPQNLAICKSKEIRCKQESNGTVVVLPAFYNEKNTYPALITLPGTTLTPANYVEEPFSEQYKTRTENPFIVILLPVTGSKNDYPPLGDIALTIKRYEKLVRSNLDDLIPKYKIDKSRIVLAGSSLGGDLSWALTLRNPEVFRSGTIVINSQSTYPDEGSMKQLAAKGARFVLISSEIDQENRLRCMRIAAKKLADNGVTHWFGVIPGKDFYSSDIRVKMLMPSVDYILFKKSFDRRSWNHLTLTLPASPPEKQEKSPCLESA